MLMIVVIHGFFRCFPICLFFFFCRFFVGRRGALKAQTHARPSDASGGEGPRERKTWAVCGLAGGPKVAFLRRTENSRRSAGLRNPRACWSLCVGSTPDRGGGGGGPRRQTPWSTHFRPAVARRRGSGSLPSCAGREAAIFFLTGVTPRTGEGGWGGGDRDRCDFAVCPSCVHLVGHPGLARQARARPCEFLGRRGKPEPSWR